MFVTMHYTNSYLLYFTLLYNYTEEEIRAGTLTASVLNYVRESDANLRATPDWSSAEPQHFFFFSYACHLP